MGAQEQESGLALLVAVSVVLRPRNLGAQLPHGTARFKGAAQLYSLPNAYEGPSFYGRLSNLFQAQHFCEGRYQKSLNILNRLNIPNIVNIPKIQQIKKKKSLY